MLRRILSTSLMAVLASALLLTSGITAEEETVLVGIVYGFTGPAATCARRDFEGIALAIEEINATGGLLGKRIEYFTLDTESKPPVSAAAMRKAVEKDPFVVFGTCYSSSTIVNMWVLEEAGIPQIVASESPKITQSGNYNIFRMSYNTDLQAEKFVKYIAVDLAAKKIAMVYVEDEWGKSGRDSVAAKLEEYGAEIVIDLPTTVGQPSYTGEIAKVQGSGADIVYAYLHEDELARFLSQAKGLGMRIVGAQPASLMAEKVGKDADGFISFTGLSPSMPAAEDFNVRYEQKWGRAPIDESMKGYIAAYVMKETVERIGEVDRQKFRDELHGATICVEDEPGVLMHVHYDEYGDVDRDSAIATVENGETKLLEVIGPLHPENFERCSK